MRGFRIELEEIDVHLRAEPAVEDAVTIVRETADGTQQLLSYVVGSATPDVAAIRANLARTTSRLYGAEHDRRAGGLSIDGERKSGPVGTAGSVATGIGAAESYVEPRNQVEEILAAVWKDVLRLERVGVFDNFFALGGDSIRTLQVIARANQRGVKLTPKELFEHQTIAAAAAVALWKDATAATEVGADSALSDATAARGSSPADITAPPSPGVDSDADAGVLAYPLTGMDGAGLAGLRDDWNDIEDCYPLSPMQEGMLFHTLMNPGTGMYLMQQYYVWDGRLDRDAFGRAWQRVVDRHPILRTSFMWDDLKHPLQVVHRHVNAADVIDDFDWTDRDEEAQRATMTELLERELETGFDLARAPLMRIRLVRQTPDRFTIVRSFHHILTDDWCFSLLMMDFLAHYEAFIEGRDLEAPLPPPYRDYIAWLQRQDLGAAEKFWRQELAGFSMPTPLGIERLDPDTPAAGATVGDVYMELSLAVSARIQVLALANQVTPNTFVQGAWALLLSRYSGEEQVLFGVTVAGRPTELPGVEDIVGLFINTLPLRVTVPPHVQLIGWLKHLLAENYQSASVRIRATGPYSAME